MTEDLPQDLNDYTIECNLCGMPLTECEHAELREDHAPRCKDTDDMFEGDCDA